MAISLEEVEKIGKLARLEFNDQEKQKLQSELSGILDYVDQLKDVRDTAQEVHDPESLNLMRDDVFEELVSPTTILSQAPSKEGNFIKVKSILD